MPAVYTTIDALNGMGMLVAIRDGVNHVSVVPAPHMGTLQDWIDAGSSHPCIGAVKSVIIKYKGTIVIKEQLIMGESGFSCGVIVLGDDVQSTNTVKHEQGHIEQLKNMGMKEYVTKIVVPSVIAFALDSLGKLTYDYYGSPWEAEADRLGGVHRTYDNTPWPADAYNSYEDLIKMFFD